MSYLISVAILTEFRNIQNEVKNSNVKMKILFYEIKKIKCY